MDYSLLLLFYMVVLLGLFSYGHLLGLSFVFCIDLALVIYMSICVATNECGTP